MVHGAIDAISLWLVYGTRKLLPTVPDDLIDELARKVGYLRQPELDFAIHRVSSIVRCYPDVLSDFHVQLLCAALERLQSETDPSYERSEAVSYAPAPTLEERPKLRADAARLACVLWNYYRSSNLSISEVLASWKRIGEEDPLPEVRRAWHSCDPQ